MKLVHLGVAALLLSACDSNLASDQEAGSFVPTDGSASWSLLAQVDSPDFVIPELCDPPWRFTVRSNGAFEAGPCRIGDTQVKRGRLTRAELSDLDSRAQVVAEKELNGSPECESNDPSVDRTVDLTLPDNQTFRIYETTADVSTCHLNGKAEVESLVELLASLRAKYYPRKVEIPR